MNTNKPKYPKSIVEHSSLNGSKNEASLGGGPDGIHLKERTAKLFPSITYPAKSRVAGGLCALALAILITGTAGVCADVDLGSPAQTNSAGDDIPKLRPPLPQIPETIWDEHRLELSCAAVAAAIAAFLAIWRLTRPKPPVVVAPVAQAHAELESLRTQPETGAVLSKVSQVVRHYFTGAFGLPPGELTTTEFCRAIGTVDKLDPDLASGVAGFLRQCDERKFAPQPVQPPLGAVTQATQLIDQAETRRSTDDR